MKGYLEENLSPKSPPNISHHYKELPLSFFQNNGQQNDEVVYYAQGQGFQCCFGRGKVWLTEYRKVNEKPKEAGMLENIPIANAEKHNVQGVTLEWSFLESNEAVVPEVRNKQLGTVNYFHGNDPEKWITEIPTFGEVVYQKVWPGIDIVFYGHCEQIKYDLVVQPGANVADIQIVIDGAGGMEVDVEGDLQILTPLGTWSKKKPTTYQEIEGYHQPVDCRYILRTTADGKSTIGFEVSKDFNPSFPLVIDPLVYSTFLGGSSSDLGYGIALDISGNAYVTGYTSSVNFPTTPGVVQTVLAGSIDVFITKFNPIGTALIYSTYLGGANFDVGYGIHVDVSGNAYITGYTTANFPTTPGVVQAALAGGADAFVTKINSTGTSLIYSTYLGGSGNDYSYGIFVNTSGNAYVSGRTDSANFPTTLGVIQTALAGGIDAFATMINSTGTSLVYSTYVGGTSNDYSRGISIDTSGNAYLVGYTSIFLRPSVHFNQHLQEGSMRSLRS